MGTVLHVDFPARQDKPSRQAALLACFAEARRPPLDVFWMKENAEALNVLECTGGTGGKLEASGLFPHASFYAGIERQIAFFPQYYRFFLSICLDLEDLGQPGDKGEALCAWAARSGLAEAELSDLQRAEARRLMMRRGIDPVAHDTGLDARLRAFTARSDTFALPNKKAAYELTHIVFYLSEYGRRDPGLDAAALTSLRHAGTLAFLELNIDLLSEVCIALRFAGATPPEIWERWLADQASRFHVVEAEPRAAAADDYHPWLMLNWAMAVAGRPAFSQDIPEGCVAFVAPSPAAGPLRELSDSMYGLDGPRSDDWHAMRDRVGDTLSTEARVVLEAAEQAVDFECFFRGFARAAIPAVAEGVAL
jgi:hypothetical protein